MTTFYFIDWHAYDGLCSGERRHTRQKTHAVNGPCAEPEKDARFVEIKPGVYAERDEGLMAFIARRRDETGN